MIFDGRVKLPAISTSVRLQRQAPTYWSSIYQAPLAQNNPALTSTNIDATDLLGPEQSDKVAAINRRSVGSSAKWRNYSP
jgi:hypothetical protein